MEAGPMQAFVSCYKVACVDYMERGLVTCNEFLIYLSDVGSN